MDSGLAHGRFLPEPRLAALMADLFGVELATGDHCRHEPELRRAVRELRHRRPRAHRGGAVEHRDETGLRIGGKTQWLHVAATSRLPFCRISPKRGDMPENLAGIAVHDRPDAATSGRRGLRGTPGA